MHTHIALYWGMGKHDTLQWMFRSWVRASKTTHAYCRFSNLPVSVWMFLSCPTDIFLITVTCQSKMRMKKKVVLSAISRACIDAATVAKRREEKVARVATN